MTHIFKEKIEFVLNATGMMDTIIDELMDLQVNPSWENLNRLIESIETYQRHALDHHEANRQDLMVQRESEAALLDTLIANLSDDY